MKNTPTPTRSALRLSTLIAGLGALGFVFVPSVNADDFYWGSDTTGDETADATSWQDGTHWFSDAAGTVAAGAAPGASDTAIFSIDSLNATTLVPRIWADTTVARIDFNNTVAFNLTGGGSNRLLHIGSGGVNLASDALGVTFGTSAANRNVLVRILADQTWTNNSSNTINIRNSAAASNLAVGDVVLTLNAAGSGNISNSGAFSDGTAGSLGLAVNSTGSGIVSIQNSAYTGGTTIQRGILQVSGGSGSASVGTADVLLGNTTGAFNATLRVNTTAAITSNLVVQAGNTGTNLLEFVANNAAGGTYDGGITLDNTLEVGVRAVTSGATINGAISGTGDLIKGQYQGGNSGILILAGANTYTGDTFVNNGAFTLADGGSITFSIGADDVNNQVTGTSTGAVTFDGDFNFTFGLDAFVDGNSWTIVDMDALSNVSFAGTFGINGFTEVDDVWTNGSGFTFTESDGVLTYAAIPEPGSLALLAGAAVLGLGALRRRRAV